MKSKMTMFAVAAWVCAIAPAVAPWYAPAAAAAAPSEATSSAFEWPATFDGKLLRPLATTPVEQRFAKQFPGRIARFTDEERVLVLRHIHTPSRTLHPATDCYKGLGYRIELARLERDAQQRLWRCFEAQQPVAKGADDGPRVRVCERIEGAKGDAFTDASSWFWAATLGQSQGPWQAITVVEAL
jgi:hypothetical protein